MKPGLKIGITFLAIAIVALTLASAWSVRTGWRQVAELTEGLRIAEHVDNAIVEVTGELRRAERAESAEEWARFLARSRALETWIAEQTPLLQTRRERELIGRVAAGYARYLASADSFVRQLGGGRLTEVEQRRTAELLDQLADVRREGVGQFLADSHGYIATLQKVNLSLLAAIALFVAWLLVTAYRGILVPLRRKLSESGTALEHAQALASLGVLASGVAHEIRNPLTAIKARLYTHQKALPKDTPGHQDCEFIGAEINRLEHIVREFLQFARPAEPQLAEMSPAGLLREVQELLAPELRKSSIELASDGAVGTAIQADAHQIKQVLINLVRNAAESIGEGGKITLRARESRLKAGGGRAIALEVTDTGKGIPADVQQRLFDPFFTTKPSGTGLGLSIAARIVEKHAGALEFTTQPDRGTTFRIVLPIQRNA